MAGKRFLDTAALSRVVWSVASKHLALRKQQFDVYSKTSSVARAMLTRTRGVAPAVKAVSAFAGRLNKSGFRFSSQSTEGKSRSHTDHNQNSSTIDFKEAEKAPRSGLHQDCFYEKSEENSVADPPPINNLHVEQPQAERYPLPGGSIPPAGSDIGSSNLLDTDQDTFSIRPQTVSQTAPLPEVKTGGKEDILPVSSDRSSIPVPNKRKVVHAESNPQRLSDIRNEDRQDPVPAYQAEPEQDSLSNENYSELFHSPKVARLLKGGPSQSNLVNGLKLRGPQDMLSETAKSSQDPDQESFNVRAPQLDTNQPMDRSVASSNHEKSENEDVQSLADSIAQDVTTASPTLQVSH